VPDFKPLSRDAIPSALEKATRYRLLNEPGQAESICLDVLAIDPDNQQALITQLLALTDQFPESVAECFAEAEAIVPRLEGEYERWYYRGLIAERRGCAVLLHESPGAHATACEWVYQAMACYEKAEPLRPAGNDDVLLRWNHCVRLCQRYHLDREPDEQFQPVLGDDYDTGD
jgi:hypothetical protein